MRTLLNSTLLFLFLCFTSTSYAESFSEQFVDGKPVLQTVYDIIIGNILNVGTKTDEDITIYAYNGDLYFPAIQYTSLSDKWQISNDGVNFYDIISSSSGDDRYLKLDQTTPQTVINDKPILEEGVAIGSNISYIAKVSGNTMGLYINSILVQSWTSGQPAGAYYGFSCMTYSGD